MYVCLPISKISPRCFSTNFRQAFISLPGPQWFSLLVPEQESHFPAASFRWGTHQRWPDLWTKRTPLFPPGCCFWILVWFWYAAHGESFTVPSPLGRFTAVPRFLHLSGRPLAGIQWSPGAFGTTLVDFFRLTGVWLRGGIVFGKKTSFLSRAMFLRWVGSAPNQTAQLPTLWKSLGTKLGINIMVYFSIFCHILLQRQPGCLFPALSLSQAAVHLPKYLPCNKCSVILPIISIYCETTVSSLGQRLC